MQGWTYAVLERLHGHIAWLGLALLLHPVITLRTRERLGRWTCLTADLGAALILAPALLGAILYPAYRAGPKRDLLEHAPGVAAAFEVKEHLASFGLVLAIGGAVVLHAAGQTRSGRRAAWSLLSAAWICVLGAAVTGIAVAGWAHPAW